MSKIWNSEAPALIFAIATLVVLGMLTDDWLTVTLVVSGGYILWLYHRLAKLEKWIRRGTKISQAYDDPGFIGTIIRQLYQQKKQHNLRKRRTKTILRRLNRNISALPDATVLINSDYEIIWCNEPARYLLNIRSPQDLGYRISNLIRDPDFNNYLNGRHSRETIEIPSPADPTVTVQIKITAIGGQQSLLIAHNVSDQKLLQESLKNFVANASHELKSPLTVISGHLEMLESEPKLSASGKKSLMAAQRQTERMRDLIRSLLLLSQVESYQLRPDEGDRVNIGQIMTNVVSAMEKFPDHERVDFDYPSDWFLVGVKAELEGICINLVENALKYATENTPIRAVWDSNLLGEFSFTVSNLGPGIEPQDLPRLTERYFRSARTSAEVTGSGLGLAIVQHAAAKHGATLTIDSDMDGETRFCVTFPSYRCIREQRKTARVYQLSDY